MTTNIYDIVEEPQGNIYHEILNCASDYSSEFLLVLRHSLPADEAAQDIIDALSPFLISRSEQEEWPGTRLFEETASVHRFKVCSPAMEILRLASDSLFAWQQPQLPEDLCFLRSNGTPWLVTIAHEQDAYFSLSHEEKVDIEAAIGGLMLKHHIDANSDGTPWLPAG